MKYCSGHWCWPVLGVLLSLTAHAADKPKIGMPMPTLNDAFWVDYVSFAKSAAEAYGYELVVTDAQAREDKQLGDIETLINAGVKGIILTPLSEPLGIQALEITNKANVPVVVTDTFPGVEVGSTPNYLAFIKLDDETAGYNVAKHLIEKDGVKKIVGIGGVPGISTSEARNDGLKKAVAEHPDVELLDVQYTDWTLAKGQTVMEDFLTRFDAIDGVWGAGSDPLLGRCRLDRECRPFGRQARRHRHHCCGARHARGRQADDARRWPLGHGWLWRDHHPRLPERS